MSDDSENKRPDEASKAAQKVASGAHMNIHPAAANLMPRRRLASINNANLSAAITDCRLLTLNTNATSLRRR
jgi:hypothetical protein